MKYIDIGYTIDYEIILINGYTYRLITRGNETPFRKDNTY